MVVDKKINTYRVSSILIFALVIILDLFVFIFSLIENKFSWVDLIMLLFDLVVISFTIFSLGKRNIKLLDLLLVILKVFDGLYFLFEAMRELDEGISSTKHGVMFSFFLVSSIFLLISFICYCIYVYTNKKCYWNVMKYILLVAALFMIVYGILAVVFKPNTIEVWTKFFEPFIFALLFLGIFTSCQYIETNNNKNIANLQ